jgi:perosamine synthetase
VLLDAETANNRDKLLDALNAVGIRARPAWTLMHRLPMYRDCPRMPLDTAEDIERRLVNLPSSPTLMNGVA